MKKYNLLTKKEYEGNDGTLKKQWNNVGTLVKFDAVGEKPESFIIELNMFPETKFFVFEQENRTKKVEPTVDQATGKVYPQEVTPDEIPF